MAYRRRLYDCLCRRHEVELFAIEDRRPPGMLEKVVERVAFARRLQRIHGQKDLWIRDFREMAFLGPLQTEGPQIVLLHHHDARVQPNRLYNEIADRVALHRLREIDAIVTVSRYWQARLLAGGRRAVHVIHNAIDPQDFGCVTTEDDAEFRRRLGLPPGRLVYVGNRGRGKGSERALAILRGEDFQPVTSGRPRIELPCPNVEGSYPDYLKLLHHAEAALLLSQFDEGWCISAHEAMMCATPVIGSGRGGMRELLEGGGQFASEDPEEIRSILRRLRSDPAWAREVGARGRRFAAQFTPERFERAWLDLVARTGRGGCGSL